MTSAPVLEVRLATSDDVGIMSELLRSTVIEQTDVRGAGPFVARELRPSPFEASFTQSFSAENTAAWIGELDQVPLGFATVHTENLRDQTTLVVIDEIVVHADAREIGLGEELMATVVTWSTEQNANAIDAYALPGDRNTKNFFEMSAFTARLITMHHKLK